MMKFRNSLFIGLVLYILISSVLSQLINCIIDVRSTRQFSVTPTEKIGKVCYLGCTHGCSV